MAARDVGMLKYSWNSGRNIPVDFAVPTMKKTHTKQPATVSATFSGEHYSYLWRVCVCVCACLRACVHVRSCRCVYVRVCAGVCMCVWVLFC